MARKRWNANDKIIIFTILYLIVIVYLSVSTSLTNLTTIVAAIITALALWFAVIQIFLAQDQKADAIEQTKFLREQTQKLENIYESIQTSYIGIFPEFLKKVVELTKGAKNIIILCDLPAYGVVSDKHNFDNYITHIKNTKIPVELVCLNRERREEVSNNQLKATLEKDKKEWDKWSIEEPIRTKINDLFNEYWKDKPEDAIPDPKSEQDLLKCIEKANVKVVTNNFKNARVSPRMMSIYFWIRDVDLAREDGEEAIFAIRDYTGKAREIGFKTIDKNLIKALINIYTGYKADSKPLA